MYAVIIVIITKNNHIISYNMHTHSSFALPTPHTRLPEVEQNKCLCMLQDTSCRFVVIYQVDCACQLSNAWLSTKKKRSSKACLSRLIMLTNAMHLFFVLSEDM